MRTIFLLLLLSFVNCATTLSSFHPADTLPKNSFHLSYDTGINLPISKLGDALFRMIELNITIEQKKRYRQSLTEEEKKDLMKYGIALALNPPTGSNEFQLRYGLGKEFEIGLKWAISTLIGDVRYQFLGIMTRFP